MSDTDINNVYADIERIADFHISPPKTKNKETPKRICINISSPGLHILLTIPDCRLQE